LADDISMLGFILNSIYGTQMKVFNKEETRNILNTKLVMEEIKKACLELNDGVISSPERMVVQRPNAGVLLSMPATAPDISSHKLVNVEPSNSQRGLPTIHGLVTVFDTETGKPICLLDGPEVTGARTAAVSMIGIETFLDNTPKKVLIIGTGAQAQYHIRALNDVYPDAEIYVRGIDKESAEDFCKSNEGNSHLIACDPDYIPEDVDVVILLTTSTKPIYNFSGKSGRLIIGVGAFKPEMAEIGKETLFSSNVFVDDFAGAKEEAGDLIQANVDWSSVKGLALALTSKVDKKEPFVFKTVGTGAWDLAASRVAAKLV
jgi:1-piperideine-2-carboxylate/1-pyrroline-2-carboxylate reductase [NAD(P)H]